MVCQSVCVLWSLWLFAFTEYRCPRKWPSFALLCNYGHLKCRINRTHYIYFLLVCKIHCIHILILFCLNIRSVTGAATERGCHSVDEWEALCVWSAHLVVSAFILMRREWWSVAETETDSVRHKYWEQKITAQTNQRKQEVSKFALASTNSTPKDVIRQRQSTCTLCMNGGKHLSTIHDFILDLKYVIEKYKLLELYLHGWKLLPGGITNMAAKWNDLP